MSDSYLPVLAAVIAALKADATLTAIVPAARIYSDVVDNPTFPFVVVSMASSPFDTKTTSGMTHTCQVSIFSRKTSPQELGQARSAVYNVLHKQETSFAGIGVSDIMFNGTAPTLKESDGQTWHCPMQYRITVGS